MQSCMGEYYYCSTKYLFLKKPLDKPIKICYPSYVIEFITVIDVMLSFLTESIQLWLIWLIA